MRTAEDRRNYQREYNKTHKAEVRALKRKWIAEHPQEWRDYCLQKMLEKYHRDHPGSRYNKKRQPST